ncbi:MAG: AbrB/MazE/SpoVT family DNA-binding domain-containing protein [Minisyncoccia bacterium]
MPTRKIGQTNIRKITKVGKASLAVTLPIDLVRKFKWREGQKVVVSSKGKTLVVKDWKK